MKYCLLTCLFMVCQMNVFARQAYSGRVKDTNDSLMLTADTLSQVIISASREKQPRKEVPVAISKIGGAVIKETHATALYQLLNKTSGVYMVNLGNEQHTMAIRQPITYNALYLYMEDGLPIRPTGIFNHNALYEINMNGLADIEVIKGPASSLYGSNAIGGAVNFITTDPFETGNNKISFQGDGYHYYRGDASAAISRGKLGVLIAGYAANQKDGWQDYTDFSKYSASVKAVYDMDHATRLSIAGTFNYLDTQTPGSLDSARFYSRNYGSNQRFTYRKVNAFRSSARIDHRWNSRTSGFISLFFRNNSTRQLPSYYIQDIRNSSGLYQASAGQENNQTFNSYGFLMQHKMKSAFLNSEMIAGFYLDNSPGGFYADYLDIHKDPGSNYYTNYTNTDSLIDDYRIRLFNTAAYLQYTIHPAEPLRIVAGLRYDRIVYDFKNRLPAERTKYKQEETNHFNTLAPKLGATYDLGAGRGIYTNFSIGVQPPETSNLYSSRQQARLKQATFYNYEFGGWLPLLNNRIKVELSAYNMDGRNEIISVLMPDNTTQNQNAGSTRHRGIEYSISFQPDRQWQLRFNGTNARHTYLQYTEVSSGKTVSYDGKRMTNAPSYISNTELSWRPQFIAGFIMTMEWQHLDNYYVNPANTKTYNGYDLFNVRTGYNLKSSFARGAGIWLNVMNLSDKLYATTVTGNQYGLTYTAASPRTFSLGLSYTFAK